MTIEALLCPLIKIIFKWLYPIRDVISEWRCVEEKGCPAFKASVGTQASDTLCPKTENKATSEEYFSPLNVMFIKIPLNIFISILPSL